MSENSFVSFIIPSYNSGQTINKCLSSIKDIDYPKNRLEIIIADNGSKDDTVGVAKEFTDKIFIDNVATIAKLRNIGARQAKGDFLVFLDSDCMIRKDWLRVALEYFKDDNIGLVGSKSFILPDIPSWVEETWKLHTDRTKDDKNARWVVSRAIIIKKALFLAVGGFNESLETCEDVEFGYRIGKRYRIVSDEKLAPLHLSRVTTIFDFFKKETWRAKDGLKVGLMYITQWHELLSLFFLFYYLLLFMLLVPFILVTFLTKKVVYLTVVLFGIILPLFLLSFDTCRRAKKYSYFWRLFIVYSAYILGRIVAMFR